MIHPSPAIAVRAETPISECVRLMRDNNVGSVLVVSDDFEYKLLGIFTERDLLMRAHLIQEGSHWEKAVHSVMTRPVITARLDQLELAPRIMVDNGIRHLPVLDESGRLVGVVSMRDFFREWARKGAPESALEKPRRREVRVLSKDPALLKLLALRATRLRQLSTVAEFSALLETPSSIPLVLDVDIITAPELSRLLKKALAQDPRPRIFMVFDPAQQTPKGLKQLQGLEKVEGIALFARPLNLLALSEALTLS